ncbi:zinc ribbon domain-containing protein [Tychonema sp. BBK16]|uniref:zinc ribbon domain-containing protein n=1 Tax=Tychonema sp. BBK16 TaxID=2699888 RepID=UPI004040C91D
MARESSRRTKSSICGNHRHKMPLKDRVYMCPNFGHKKNRDLNVAKNIVGLRKFLFPSVLIKRIQRNSLV